MPSSLKLRSPQVARALGCDDGSCDDEAECPLEGFPELNVPQNAAGASPRVSSASKSALEAGLGESSATVAAAGRSKKGGGRRGGTKREPVADPIPRKRASAAAAQQLPTPTTNPLKQSDSYESLSDVPPRDSSPAAGLVSNTATEDGVGYDASVSDVEADEAGSRPALNLGEATAACIPQVDGAYDSDGSVGVCYSSPHSCLQLRGGAYSTQGDSLRLPREMPAWTSYARDQRGEPRPCERITSPRLTVLPFLTIPQVDGANDSPSSPSRFSSVLGRQLRRSSSFGAAPSHVSVHPGGLPPPGIHRPANAPSCAAQQGEEGTQRALGGRLQAMLTGLVRPFLRPSSAVVTASPADSIHGHGSRSQNAVSPSIVRPEPEIAQHAASAANEVAAPPASSVPQGSEALDSPQRKSVRENRGKRKLVRV